MRLRPDRATVRRLRTRAVTTAAGARRHLGRDSGAVALTFDDGPHPEFTPQVLDRLAALDVVATFFLVGRNAARHPDLVRRIVDRGHAVGSHSWSHPDPWTLGLRHLIVDYRRGRQAVERASGGTARLFRPPKEHLGRRGPVAVRVVRLRPWLSSIDSEDWVPGTSTEQILARVEPVSPGDVILLHDWLEGALDERGLDRSETVAAIDGIVTMVRDRGLRLVRLP